MESSRISDWKVEGEEKEEDSGLMGKQIDVHALH